MSSLRFVDSCITINQIGRKNIIVVLYMMLSHFLYWVITYKVIILFYKDDMIYFLADLLVERWNCYETAPQSGAVIFRYILDILKFQILINYKVANKTKTLTNEIIISIFFHQN